MGHGYPSCLWPQPAPPQKAQGEPLVSHPPGGVGRVRVDMRGASAVPLKPGPGQGMLRPPRACVSASRGLFCLTPGCAAGVGGAGVDCKQEVQGCTPGDGQAGPCDRREWRTRSG